jgi:hypothetical protein
MVLTGLTAAEFARDRENDLRSNDLRSKMGLMATDFTRGGGEAGVVRGRGS